MLRSQSLHVGSLKRCTYRGTEPEIFFQHSTQACVSSAHSSRQRGTSFLYRSASHLADQRQLIFPSSDQSSKPMSSAGWTRPFHIAPGREVSKPDQSMTFGSSLSFWLCWLPDLVSSGPTATFPMVSFTWR